MAETMDEAAEQRASDDIEVAAPAVGDEAEAEGGVTAPDSTPSRLKFAVRTPGPLRKRPLSSTAAQISYPPIPWRKKTRELPNLSICHGCGLRFPDKGRNEVLQALDSQWRVVFLCSGCLKDIRSANVCSYCFSRPSEGDRVIDCCRCRCRVHTTCLPSQRGYIVPLDLDPNLFTCVDCCALPKFFSPRCSSHPDVSVDKMPTYSLENVVKDANNNVDKKAEAASRAKQKALEKAMAAKHATELARSALELAALTSKKSSLSSPGSKPSLLDEELALQLHLAMNGSQRISRNHSSTSSQNLLDPTREVSFRKYLYGNRNGCSEFQVCVENRSFDSLDADVIEPLVCDSGLQQASSLKFDSCRGNDVKLENGEISRGDMVDVHVREEQASCSDKIMTSAGDEITGDSISASSQRSNSSFGEGVGEGLSKGDGEGEGQGSSAACQQPNRYLKKYCRTFRLRNRVESKESVGSAPVLVPFWPISFSNTSRNFDNSAYESPTVGMDSFPNASGSSGYQS